MTRMELALSAWEGECLGSSVLATVQVRGDRGTSPSGRGICVSQVCHRVVQDLVARTSGSGVMVPAAVPVSSAEIFAASSVSRAAVDR